MDRQNIQTVNDVIAEYQMLMKVTKLILSLTVFFFFLSNPSCISFFLHSFISYLSSNFPSQLLSLVSDKNYIFLLCNGILIVLVKSSGKVFSSSETQGLELESPLPDILFDENTDTLPLLEPASNTNAQPPSAQAEEERRAFLLNMNEKVAMEAEEEEEKKVLVEDMVQGEEEMELEYVLSVEEESLKGGEENGRFKEEEEEENQRNIKGSVEGGGEEQELAEEELSIARMSIENLNRKFEEFIRRMKEEIRIESQTQLVLV